MRLSGIFFLGIICATGAAYGGARDDLNKTREEIAKAEERKEQLAADQEKLENELAGLKKKLVRAAANLQRSEKQVAEAENTLASLTKQKEQKEKDLESQQTKLDGLSRIAIRISRTPPQAMILMPGDGSKRLQASQALAVLTKDMEREAAAIRKNLEELAVLKEKVTREKATAEKLRAAVKQEKDAFEKSLKERERLRDALVADYKKTDARIAKLVKQASSLQGLVASLEDVSTQAGEIKPGIKDVRSKLGVSGRRGQMRYFKSARGDIRIPVSGKLVTRFGEKDKANDTSKGMTIKTWSEATVVAPYDAEVAYTGPFLNYGKLVILKHRGDYHTLLAGLHRIDINTGDFLLEGEPIGAMGTNSRRDLYVELRENNQPVDPAKWMYGL